MNFSKLKTFLIMLFLGFLIFNLFVSLQNNGQELPINRLLYYLKFPFSIYGHKIVDIILISSVFSIPLYMLKINKPIQEYFDEKFYKKQNLKQKIIEAEQNVKIQGIYTKANLEKMEQEIRLQNNLALEHMMKVAKIQIETNYHLNQQYQEALEYQRKNRVFDAQQKISDLKRNLGIY